MQALSKFTLAAALALPGAAALADPLYQLTVIGGIGSSAAGINSLGDVVGDYTSNGAVHGFTYIGGTFADVGTFGGSTSSATAINDQGQVVGSAATASGQTHAFLLSGGSLGDLGTLGGANSTAYAINNHGVVVGQADNGDSPFGQAFSYAGGSLHNLGTLPGALGSFAYAINDAGLIAGASYRGPLTMPEYPLYAVTYKNGGVHDLGAPDLGDSAIYGLNDHGVAVGGIPTSNFIHGSHAALYQNGSFLDLGFLASSVDDSIARDINNLGQVVGSAAVDVDADTYGYHGFLYTGNGLVDLNTLIDPASGWQIANAAAINDASQIAATACRGGLQGDCYAVRLDLVPAVPEPGSWAMLAGGLGLIGLRRRGQRMARPLA